MRVVNRTGWPHGPWDGEPDRDEWLDAATGYACVASRNYSGAWCGYVRVPPTHPLHGMDYSGQVPDSLTSAAEKALDGPIGKRGVMAVVSAALKDGMRIDSLLDVHGSITYAGELRDVEGHWFGFDCSHLHDMSPGVDWFDAFDIYRDLDYVKAECSSLARQLADLTGETK